MGLGEQSLSLNFKVFPNPNNGSFTLQNEANKDCSVSIFDINGREIVSGKTISGLSQETIELTVKPGVYFVKIQNEESSRIERLMITE